MGLVFGRMLDMRGAYLLSRTSLNRVHVMLRLIGGQDVIFVAHFGAAVRGLTDLPRVPISCR